VFQFLQLAVTIFSMTKKSFGLPKLGVLVVAVSLLSGCAAAEPSPSASQLTDDFQADIATPTALTVAGIAYTLEDLQQRGASEVEILEPFKKETTTFTVIDFDQLLVDSGFASTDSVETIALNDYRYSDTLQAFADNGSLLAIYENGEPIPVADGGPVRIIFTEESPYYSVLDAWNWSLSEIRRSEE
jgi:hypothetical protein